jgi:sugar phosphate isomerase/epimerase
MSEKRSPRAMGPEDFVLNHLTLDRHHPLDDRIEAAAAAGFTGIGLLIENYRHVLVNGYSDARIAELLITHGIRLSDIEVLRGWAQGHGEGSDEEQFAWRLADTFGCRYVQAIGPYSGTIAEAGDAFGALCDRAADHGLLVGLEFLPFTNIYSAADAMEIIERADRANGGICLDIWHHHRGAHDLDMIRAIPADRIMAVQINDGAAQQIDPDYKQDCLRHRLPPGDGVFDLAGFIQLLLDKGSQAPWSLEVCLETAWNKPALPHVQACADGLRTLLAAAGQR